MSINQTHCNITDTKVNDKVLEGRFDKLFFTSIHQKYFTKNKLVRFWNMLIDEICSVTGIVSDNCCVSVYIDYITSIINIPTEIFQLCDLWLTRTYWWLQLHGFFVETFFSFFSICLFCFYIVASIILF